MRDDPVWFDDPEDAPAPRTGSRRAIVLAIAAIPWMLVAALVLLPDRTVNPAGTASPPSAAADTQAGTTTTAVPSSDSAPAPPVPPAPSAADRLDTEVDTPIRHPHDAGTTLADIGTELSTRDSLAAVATVVARAWLTGVSPHLDVPGLTPTDPSSYAEHVVVEAIDRHDPHLAVVTVLAVQLRESPEGLRVDTRRVAVPLATTDGRVHPVDEPWWLPTPDLRSGDLPAEPQTDPAWFEAAVTGLRAAGLQDIEVTALERTDHWPWRAHITARTADGQPIDGPVWLRWTGQGFEVAGHVPASSAATPPDTPPDLPPDVPPGTPSDVPPDVPADDQQEVDP